MNCPNCHSEIPDASVFCPECGQKVEIPAAPAPEAPAAPAPQTVPQGQYTAPAPQQGTYTPPQQTYAAPQQTYSAPQQTYSAPQQQTYSAPQQPYAAQPYPPQGQPGVPAEKGGLATGALVCAFLLPGIGFILGIVGAVKFKTKKFKTRSIIAIVVSIVISLIGILGIRAIAKAVAAKMGDNIQQGIQDSFDDMFSIDADDFYTDDDTDTDDATATNDDADTATDVPQGLDASVFLGTYANGTYSNGFGGVDLKVPSDGWTVYYGEDVKTYQEDDSLPTDNPNHVPYMENNGVRTYYDLIVDNNVDFANLSISVVYGEGVDTLTTGEVLDSLKKSYANGLTGVKSNSDGSLTLGGKTYQVMTITGKYNEYSLKYEVAAYQEGNAVLYITFCTSGEAKATLADTLKLLS